MVYLLKSAEFRKLENDETEFFFSLKIGYTDDENTDLKKNKRLNMYFAHHRSIELLYIIPNGTEEQEKKLHYKFRSFRWDNSSEWYIYDQSIIDYLKSVTLEELDKLPSNPDVRSAKFFNTRKDLRKILQYVYSSGNEIDDVILKLASILGDDWNVESSINYLKEQGVDFSKYYEVKNNTETGKFCNDDIVNQEVADFLRGYQTLTRRGDKLRMLCEIDMSKEAMDLILNQISDSDQVKSYYINLGPERIKQLGYNVTRMNKELGIVVFSPELLIEKIYSEFKEGDKYLLTEIKDKLKEIYSSINYKKTPKATDINEFFNIKEYMITKIIDGKKKRPTGYELLKRLK